MQIQPHFASHYSFTRGNLPTQSPNKLLQALANALPGSSNRNEFSVGQKFNVVTNTYTLSDGGQIIASYSPTRGLDIVCKDKDDSSLKEALKQVEVQNALQELNLRMTEPTPIGDKLKEAADQVQLRHFAARPFALT